MSTKEERIAEIAAEFKRKMEKLNVGVKIKANDGPWITVVEPPEQAAEPSEATPASGGQDG